MSTKKMTAAEVTDAIIQGWKEKHGSVFVYKTSDGKTAYLRMPTRTEIEAAQSVGNKAMTSNGILAKSCFLAGDEDILNVDKYFFGLCDHLKEIIKKVEGELTEL